MFGYSNGVFPQLVEIVFSLLYPIVAYFNIELILMGETGAREIAAAGDKTGFLKSSQIILYLEDI